MRILLVTLSRCFIITSLFWALNANAAPGGSLDISVDNAAVEAGSLIQVDLFISSLDANAFTSLTYELSWDTAVLALDASSVFGNDGENDPNLLYTEGAFVRIESNDENHRIDLAPSFINSNSYTTEGFVELGKGGFSYSFIGVGAGLPSATFPNAFDKVLLGRIVLEVRSGASLGNTNISLEVKGIQDTEGSTISDYAAASQAITITFIDRISPVLSLPSAVTVAASDATGVVSSNAAVQDFLNSATATDAIDGNVTVSNDANTNLALGPNTITFTATDSANNIAEDTVVITVTDQTVPVITVPADITVAASNASGVSSSNAEVQAFLNAASATDAVDTSVVITNDVQANLVLGANFITFTATDSANNKENGTATITVTDQAGPVLLLPGALTVAASSASGVPSSNSEVQAFLNGVTANDVVDGSVTVTNNVLAVLELGVNTITFTATDGASNTTTGSATITVSDQAAPTLLLPDNTIVAASDATGVASSNASVQDFLNSATATDAIDGNVTVSNDANTNLALGPNTITFTATDSASNIAEGSVIITVTDQLAPVLSIPTDITVAASNASGVSSSNTEVQAFLSAASATDAVDTSVVITNNVQANLVLGANPITFTATDSADNKKSDTAIITVTDQAGPVLLLPGALTVAASSASGVSSSHSDVQAFLSGVTANDVVDGSVAVTNNVLAVLELGVNTITFTATDGTGNTTIGSATITVSDQAAPVLSLPTAVTVAAVNASSSHATVQAFLNAATANDVVDGTVIVTNNAPVTLVLGANVITFTATDSASNTTNGTVIISVTDQSAPALLLPTTITVAASSASGVLSNAADVQAFLGGATASDTVDGSVVVTNNAPVALALGENPITFTATDSANNSVNGIAIIVVADQSAPVLSVPSAVNVAATDDTGVLSSVAAVQVFLAAASANDDVVGSVTVTNNAPTLLALGPNIITFTATDSANNSASADVIITVIDKNAPLITAPKPIVVGAVDAQGTPISDTAIEAFLTSATVVDTIDGEGLSISHNANDILPLGDNTITFTATDSAGNKGSASSVISVLDLTAPDLVVPEPVTVLSGSEGLSVENSQVLVFLAGASASDNVDGTELVIANDAKGILPLGDSTITFDVIDAAGNTTSLTSQITVVEDIETPVLSVPSALELRVFIASDTIAVSNPDVQSFLNAATAVDNRDGVISAISNDLDGALSLGATVVTFEVTDSAGNVATQTATITLVLLDTDLDGMPDFYEDELGFDKNDPLDASADLDGDGVSNLDEFLANTDPSKDELPPVLTIPADIEIAATGKFTAVDLGTASAIDNKDGSLNPTANITGPFESGHYDIMWSVRDAAGNSAEKVQSLNILPLVELTPSSVTAEGETVVVTFALSGEAPAYPVNISYILTASSTAVFPSDIDLEINQIFELEIASGTQASIEINIKQDQISEQTETIEISLLDTSNAVVGERDIRTIEIVETNVAPTVQLLVQQGLLTGVITAKDKGDITIQAIVQDVNSADTHTFNWSETDSVLSDIDQVANTFTFDASGLDAGVYNIKLTVADTGNPIESVVATLAVNVLASAPVLSNQDDADNDGIPDAVESYGDADGDGIADFQDNISETNLAPISQGETVNLARSTSGTQIKLGDVALASGNAAIGVTEQDVIDSGGSAGGIQDADFNYPLALFDFEISGEVPGATYRIVLPLGGPIPSNAVYRKFTPNVGWNNFVEDASNQVLSASSIDGVCPAVITNGYTLGLEAGSDCLLLDIEDGGPNDTDGAVNGSVADPSGVAIRFIPVPNISAQNNSLSTTSFASGDGEQVVLAFILESDSSDAQINSLTIKAAGDIDEVSALNGVNLYLDQNQDGLADASELQVSGNFTADNGQIIFTLPQAYVTPVGETHFLVTYQF